MNKSYTEQLIKRLCSQPRSLNYLCQRLHGVDPISALDFLKELEKNDIVRCGDDELWLTEEKAHVTIGNFLLSDRQVYLRKYMGDFNFFKKPHPLDFEWRNTKTSVDYLSDLVLQSNHINDEILILGMPTLFANLCKRDISQAVTIVERNQGVVDSLKELAHDNCKVIVGDIFKLDSETVGMYATVVMDPPWYEPHFYQFIWLASRCIKLGGRLIISIPPFNTRPGIDKERIAWFTFCQQQGLCLESLSPGRLEYAMPFFEWNAVRIAGALTNPFWRHGDLAIFQKLKSHFVERPDYEEQNLGWREVEINSCRIRIKIDEDVTDCSPEKLDIDALVASQILPSVSSRDPRRREANIWTSGNRIFSTNNPRRLYTYLRDFNDNISPDSEDEKKAFEFIKVISDFENEEYNEYLEWLYREMEREAD